MKKDSWIYCFSGGLGNQMFQYAFYKSLTKIYNDKQIKADIMFILGPEEHNGYELYKIFNIQIPKCSKYEALCRTDYCRPLALKGKAFMLLQELFYRYVGKECTIITQKQSTEFLKDMHALNVNKSYLFRGYWINEKYFQNVVDDIKCEFKFPTLDDERNADSERLIRETESVSIHVRRTDYLSVDLSHLAMDYYLQAIQEIEKRVENPVYFIFSDDIAFIEQNFSFLKNYYIIDYNRGKDSYKDMQLMSLCKHNIIANSTFSYWGAFLNTNPNKIVVEPKNLSKDMLFPRVCENSIRLENMQNEVENKRKLNILFHAWSDNGWIGGVYYVKNIVFSLLQSKETLEKINIYILTKSEFENVFSSLSDSGNVTILYSDRLSMKQKVIKKLKKIWHVNVLKRTVHRDLLSVVAKYNIDYIYPMCYEDQVYGNKGIMWIPDLQHIYYPEFFPGKALKERADLYYYMAKNHTKLVLSSNSSKDDYLKAYPEYSDNVFVVPFVSAIDNEILENDRVDEVQKKYHLEKKYFLVSNQFWKHKNHKVVFEALQLVKEKYGSNLCVACTGQMEDNRNTTYINELKEFVSHHELEENLVLLGFISREEQLQLMKGCIAVIQPSLFEGWGTVVEDAKTLRKRVILSDIDVHKEQMNEDCILFEQDNVEQLAQIMFEIWNEETTYCSRTNYDFKVQAAEYGKLFLDMLGI